MKPIHGLTLLSLTNGYCSQSRTSPTCSNDHSQTGTLAWFIGNCKSLNRSSLESVVSRTGDWNAYNYNIPIQSLRPMAMAMESLSSEQKPWLMWPSEHATDTKIVDFAETTVSNPDNDLQIVYIISVKFHSQMSYILQLQTWSTVTLSMLLHAFQWTASWRCILVSTYGGGMCFSHHQRYILWRCNVAVCSIQWRLPWALIMTCGSCGFVSLHISNGYLIVSLSFYLSISLWSQRASAKNISVRAEWLRQSGRAPSKPSETPRSRITPRPVSIPPVALHIALRSQFHRFFLRLCKSILRCSWKHLQLWRCIQDATRFDY